MNVVTKESQTSYVPGEATPGGRSTQRLTVTGVDTDGNLFREIAVALRLKGKSCVFQSKHRVAVSNSLMVEIAPTGRGQDTWRANATVESLTVTPLASGQEVFRVELGLDHAHESLEIEEVAPRASDIGPAATQPSSVPLSAQAGAPMAVLKPVTLFPAPGPENEPPQRLSQPFPARFVDKVSDPVQMQMPEGNGASSQNKELPPPPTSAPGFGAPQQAADTSPFDFSSYDLPEDTVGVPSPTSAVIAPLSKSKENIRPMVLEIAKEVFASEHTRRTDELKEIINTEIRKALQGPLAEMALRAAQAPPPLTQDVVRQIVAREAENLLDRRTASVLRPLTAELVESAISSEGARQLGELKAAVAGEVERAVQGPLAAMAQFVQQPPAAPALSEETVQQIATRTAETLLAERAAATLRPMVEEIVGTGVRSESARQSIELRAALEEEVEQRLQAALTTLTQSLPVQPAPLSEAEVQQIATRTAETLLAERAAATLRPMVEEIVGTRVHSEGTRRSGEWRAALTEEVEQRLQAALTTLTQSLPVQPAPLSAAEVQQIATRTAETLLAERAAATLRPMVEEIVGTAVHSEGTRRSGEWRAALTEEVEQRLQAAQTSLMQSLPVQPAPLSEAEVQQIATRTAETLLAERAAATLRPMVEEIVGTAVHSEAARQSGELRAAVEENIEQRFQAALTTLFQSLPVQPAPLSESDVQQIASRTGETLLTQRAAAIVGPLISETIGAAILSERLRQSGEMEIVVSEELRKALLDPLSTLAQLVQTTPTEEMVQQIAARTADNVLEERTSAVLRPMFVDIVENAIAAERFRQTRELQSTIREEVNKIVEAPIAAATSLAQQAPTREIVWQIAAQAASQITERAVIENTTIVVRPMIADLVSKAVDAQSYRQSSEIRSAVTSEVERAVHGPLTAMAQLAQAVPSEETVRNIASRAAASLQAEQTATVLRPMIADIVENAVASDGARRAEHLSGMMTDTVAREVDRAVQEPLQAISRLAQAAPNEEAIRNIATRTAAHFLAEQTAAVLPLMVAEIVHNAVASDGARRADQLSHNLNDVVANTVTSEVARALEGPLENMARFAHAAPSEKMVQEIACRTTETILIERTVTVFRPMIAEIVNEAIAADRSLRMKELKDTLAPEMERIIEERVAAVVEGLGIQEPTQPAGRPPSSPTMRGAREQRWSKVPGVALTSPQQDADIRAAAKRNQANDLIAEIQAKLNLLSAHAGDTTGDATDDTSPALRAGPFRSQSVRPEAEPQNIDQDRFRELLRSKGARLEQELGVLLRRVLEDGYGEE